MSSFINDHFAELNARHYVLKTTRSNYWVSPCSSIITRFLESYGKNFCMIIYNPRADDDCFVLPFAEVGNLFLNENMDAKGEWDVSIRRDLTLRVGRDPNSQIMPVGTYHNNFEPLGHIEESTMLVEEDGTIEQALEIEDLVERGAGFGDAIVNRDVEQAAISHVKELYEADGWDLIEDVQYKKCGYDLVFKKGSTRQDVEVKGTRGVVESCFITRREVQQAKTNSNFVIGLVTSALSEQRQFHRYSGRQFVDSFELDPLAYRVSRRK